MTDVPRTDARRRRYASCGLSSRGLEHFVLPLLAPSAEGGFAESATLVAILEADRERAEQFVRTLLPTGHPPVPVFGPDEFDRMVRETSPDTVLVATPDATHAEYVLAGLANGLDVVTEKPMTSTAADAARIIRAQRQGGGSVRVTHNMRYTDRHRQLKRLILSGAIGRVTHATLDYHVDVSHGASYFLRWNRERRNSGGLSVHKSCHHLDLLGWLLDDRPQTVFAFGARNYYGPDGANRPRSDDGTPAALRPLDPYYRDQLGTGVFPDDAEAPRAGSHGLRYPWQYPAGTDVYLYDEAVDIEDTYSAVLRYRRGASVAYSIDFSSPWEGYSLGISGTHGRLETDFGRQRGGEPRRGSESIRLLPLFAEPELFPVHGGADGHDGSDALLRQDLFGPGLQESAELGLAASVEEAAYAVAAGEAIWRSVASGLPVSVDELLE